MTAQSLREASHNSADLYPSPEEANSMKILWLDDSLTLRGVLVAESRKRSRLLLHSFQAVNCIDGFVVPTLVEWDNEQTILLVMHVLPKVVENHPSRVGRPNAPHGILDVFRVYFSERIVKRLVIIIWFSEIIGNQKYRHWRHLGSADYIRLETAPDGAVFAGHSQDVGEQVRVVRPQPQLEDRNSPH